MTEELRYEDGADALGGPLTIAMPPAKRWRCTKGHEWVGEPWNIRFDRNFGGTAFHREFNCCIECLAEHFARIAVPVEEVKEEK